MNDLTTTTGLTTYLESTPYAASEIQTLSGGRSGFLYRVVLTRPLSTGETSVVVKHARDYASSKPDYPLKAERMDFEHKALQAIASSGLSTPDSVVQVPRVAFYDPGAHLLVMSDLAPTRPLSTELLACLESRDFDRIGRLGAALGEFMGRFHRWSSLPLQAALRVRFLENETSREDVFRILWRLMWGTAAELGMESVWMEELIDREMDEARLGVGGNVIAMADFWFDNILVSELKDLLRVYVIDWEMARCARPELDVAHFAAAAYSLGHVYPGLAPDGDGSFILMREFFNAYQAHFELDEIQLGINGARDVMSFGVMMPWVQHHPDEAKEGIARVGLELLEAAHAGDMETLRKNPIVCGMY